MSFKLKTILLFLAVSLIPYALTMVLVGNSFRQELYDAVTQEMNTQVRLSVERIDQHLLALQNDMTFIAKSDIMNDVYTQDLDRRISNALVSKKNDLKMAGDFYLTDLRGVVIASSDFNAIGKKNSMKSFLSADVYSTVSTQSIGRLEVYYRVENFKRFFVNTKQRHYYIRHNDGSISLRPSRFDDSLKVSQQLSRSPSLTVVLEEKKEFAYRLLYKYEQWFILLLFGGAIFIALAAYFIATHLINPIVTFSNTAKTITRTRDYTQQVDIKRDDEIGELSQSFNSMISSMDRALHEITDLNREIEETQREVVFTMGAIGESRSKETGNHVKRVAEYSRLLALYYGLGEEEAEMLKQASPMHDIGKVAIPDAVLNKPGRFDEEERRIMDTHARLGYEMLKHSHRTLLKAAAIVAHEHHEKWDGSGYPRGLKGEEIHIFGRITALADVFDALGSDRVYKKAWEDERIFNLFREEQGVHFDPYLVDLFFEHLDEFMAIRETFRDI